tara:strand:- start:175 stop:768 length:594 start_codon:yes stop_codon:yes gene_type:complete
MFELILSLAIKFWMWTAVITFIIIGFIINMFDKKIDGRVGFKYKEYPSMKPIRIATKGKGFFSAIKMWLLGSRQWEISEDFEYQINKQTYVIPKGFKFDGASIPKFFRSFLSPTGVLLLGGLVHDYAYKYAALKPGGRGARNKPLLLLDQKRADEIFRDINIEINGFFLLNYLAYWGLRVGGFLAWNGHRKVNAKIK